MGRANDFAREQGWRRHGTGEWTDEVNQIVRHACFIRHLQGYDRNTLVYLGSGWYNVISEVELAARFENIVR